MSPDQQDKIFIVSQGEIDGRIDFDYYKPEYQKLKNCLKNSKYGYDELGNIIEDIVNGVEIREYSDTGFRYLRVSDLGEEGIIDNDIRLVNIEKIPDRVLLGDDDFLVSRSGSLGLVSHITDEIKNSIISSHIFKLKLNTKKVLPKYLEYYLRSNLGQEQILRKNNGGIIPEINQPALKSIKIILPPLKTQEEIVDKMDSALIKKKNLENESDEILNSIDDYVLSELGIELTEEKEENNYFIVDIEDIKDGRIDVFYNKPEFKKIEKQFLKSNNVVELKDIIDYVKTGTTPDTKKEPFSNEGIPFLRNTNLQKNEIITDELKHIKDEYKNTLTYSEKDDILICIAGTIGVSSVNDFGKIAINQNVSSLKIKQGISPYFISYLLNTIIFSEFFDRVSSVATIKYINNDNLLSIKIPLPSIEIQNKIANEAKNRIEKAKQLKNQATEIYEQAKNEIEKMILK